MSIAPELRLDEPPADETPEEEPLPPRRDDGMIRRSIDLAVVAACAGFVFWQLHPDLILAPTTPAGGDMGAHVWAFGYLRDVLLSDFRLAGWTPDWYAGFPVFQFYMVVPFIAMVVLNAGVAGGTALLAAGGSLALSATASGSRRAAGPVVIGTLVVLGGLGVWYSFATGVLFAAMSLSVLAGVLAIRNGRHARARLLGASAILVAVAGIALPYGPSFKLVTVSGVVAMPVSAYLFGRLARLPYPTPALLSVATLAFLFDKNFTIYGGNIASTMAGEFAFSISLALAIAYLGVLVHGLRTGTHRATAAVLLALVGLCHLIPAFFALGLTAVLLVVHVVNEAPVSTRRARVQSAVVTAGVLAIIALAALGVFATALVSTGPIVVVTIVATVIVAILWWSRLGPEEDEAESEGAPADDRRRPIGVSRTWWLVSAGAVSALLAAWWVLPFQTRTTYLNDMGWAKIAVHTEGTSIWTWFKDSVWSELVKGDLKVAAALALVGAVLSLVFKSRIGTALVIAALGLALAFVYVPQGRLWNARLLPFWYLVVYFLAAIGVGEVVRAVAHVFASRPERPVRSVTWLAAPVVLVVLAVFLGGQLRNLPGGRENPDGTYRLNASVGVPGLFSLDVPDALGVDVTGRNFVAGWAEWNYLGYERKPAYPEYRGIVSTMADVGQERGCGMSLWEYSPDLNDYGTPMALMLLPHWTDGCVGSMEGLYFEASSTTPFHFLMQSELSAAPSRAQRDLPYRDLDLDAGVEHLQLMGVKYYMARSAEANAAASIHVDLTEVAASGPWVVYEVADAPMVQPLSFEPAVTTAGETQHEWLCSGEDDSGRCTGPALDWFQDPDRWDVALAATGPDEWQRIAEDELPEARPVTPAVVDDVEVGRDGVSFTVDRPGTPVLVKQSYFPNWEVSGADGPYRVAPNLMLVVPTDTEVSMTFGRTGIDYFSYLLTLVGLVSAVALWRTGPVAVRRLREADLFFEPVD
ncbi:MAG: hypothetical protein OSA99_18280 [Acidimicrobiales bacterium]|nr:hypothetical protein [Acidimicrobiales bacterium]